jgi:predicted lipoprotein with Yx(FWY)xxD motif
MRRWTPLIALSALVLLSACQPAGGGATSAASETAGAADTVALAAAETDAGTSLVGPDEMTLYVFTQDSEGESTCSGDCAELWPPFEVPSEVTIDVAEGVTGEVGLIERDDGTTQVTYDGMPLYFYAEDAEPGDAEGEGVGGVWFIASPDGGTAEPSDDAAASDSASDDPEASPSEEEDPYDYGL